MTEQDIAPADFDLDAWIDGTSATQRSCTIVGDRKLVAQADDLLRRYETAKRIPIADRSIDDDHPDALLAQMEEIETQLEASRSTWYLQALTPEQIQSARKRAEKVAAKSKNPELRENPRYMSYIVAAAVVRVVQPDGRETHSVSGEQIERMRERMGEFVVGRLWETFTLALSEEPTIVAPFSQTSSPAHAGQES